MFHCVIDNCKLLTIFQSVMLNSNETIKFLTFKNQPIKQYAININIFMKV